MTPFEAVLQLGNHLYGSGIRNDIYISLQPEDFATIEKEAYGFRGNMLTPEGAQIVIHTLGPRVYVSLDTTNRRYLQLLIEALPFLQNGSTAAPDPLINEIKEVIAAQIAKRLAA